MGRPAQDLKPGSNQERHHRQRANALEEENRTLRARFGKEDDLWKGLSSRNEALVTRLVQTLLSLQDAGDPRTSLPISGQMRYRRPSSEKDEGSPTRWARNLENRIHWTLKPRLDEWEMRAEGRYEPPPKPEQVRCVWDRCTAYGKRIPKFVGPKDQIELVRCPACDKKLTAA